jgi:hypothetical protein
MNRSRQSLAQTIVMLALPVLVCGCPMIQDMASDEETDTGSPPTTQARLPYNSQCSEFAGLCTSSFPTAVIDILAGQGQTVTETNDPAGFTVVDADSDGVAMVAFVGNMSELGNTATQLTYEWSTDATDEDPCSRASGTVLSIDADPILLLQTGRHLIRLTVTNDVPLLTEQLPESIVEQCESFDQAFKFETIEIVVDVQ